MHAIPRKLLLATAMLALAVTPALADVTTVKVPFDFTANGRHCAAGVYRIYRNPTMSQVLILQSEDGARNFQFIAAGGDAAPNDSRVVLTFDKWDTGYTLRLVQYHNQVTSRLDSKAPEYVPTRTIIGQ